jgi:hypothetical protein
MWNVALLNVYTECYGFHGSVVDDSLLVGSDATSLRAQLWMLQRNRVPSFTNV